MRLLKMLYVKNVVVLLILAALLLAACAPGAVPATGSTQTPAPPTPQDGGVPQPPAADAVQQALAEQFGIPLDQFVLRDIEQVEWPNACLGLPQADEMCAEVITPGFRLVFEAGGQQYEVHTNEDGSQYRIAGDLPQGMPASGEILPAVAAAQAALAQQIGIALERIRLIEATEEEWTDSCLGAGGPAESCLQVITPGYRVLLEVDGMQYEVRTNQDGSIARIVDPASPGGQPGASPTDIVNQAQNLLAQQLGISAAEINLVSLEAVDWPDACLGLQFLGQMCAQVITPGYRVVFEAQGVHYAFHTDDAGGLILPAVPPLPETAGTVITWEQREANDCAQAEIGIAGVSYGACGDLQPAVALSPERLLELAYLYAAFPTFEAETQAGSVQFNGQGTEQPAAAEMRSVAEWVRLVVEEAAADQSAPAGQPALEEEPAGLVMNWSREGGIAGFCDGMAISRSGWAQPSSCRGETQINFLPARMSAEELEQLYAWADRLQDFSYEQSDGAAADGMTIRLEFRGSGSETASEDEQAAIARFTEELYNRAMN